MTPEKDSAPDRLPVSYEPQERFVPARPDWWLALLVALLAVVSDQVTKFLALRNLTEGEQLPLIGNFIRLQLVFNPGAAFSLGVGSTWIFTVLSVVIISVLFWFVPRIHSKTLAVIIGFLLGGAIGNLIDRLFQPPAFGRGHVVDFLNYNGWFVGNVADIWIVGAAIGLVLWLLVHREPAGDIVSADE